MPSQRTIPWFPLLLAGFWLAMTSLAIRDMNAFAVAVAPPAPPAAHARPSFTEEILVVAPKRVRLKPPAAAARPATKAPVARKMADHS